MSSRELHFHVLDAFTDKPFSGNPASVLLLAEKLDDSLLQKIAREFNHAETSFVWPEAEEGSYLLRWFTPTLEAPLCGHATLAAAQLLFSRNPQLASIRFNNPFAGVLKAKKVADGVELDFPLDKSLQPLSTDEAEKLRSAFLKACPSLADARFVDFVRTRNGRGTITQVELPTDLRLQDLQINSGPIAELDGIQHVLTTASRDDATRDFESRVFAPRAGIPEDPVTGSAHCSLAPYWRAKTGGHLRGTESAPFRAYQASPRGGEMRLIIDGERVRLQGQCVAVSEGIMRF